MEEGSLQDGRTIVELSIKAGSLTLQRTLIMRLINDYLAWL